MASSASLFFKPSLKSGTFVSRFVALIQNKIWNPAERKWRSFVNAELISKRRITANET